VFAATPGNDLSGLILPLRPFTSESWAVFPPGRVLVSVLKRHRTLSAD
jgi:hypothetical protein